jgi:hypothetical protein
VPEYGLAVFLLDVIVEPNAVANPCHDICQGCLTDFDWIATEVVTVQLDQIEGVQERAAVMAAIADVIEGSPCLCCHRLRPRRR